MARYNPALSWSVRVYYRMLAGDVYKRDAVASRQLAAESNLFTTAINKLRQGAQSVMITAKVAQQRTTKQVLEIAKPNFRTSNTSRHFIAVCKRGFIYSFFSTVSKNIMRKLA